MEYKDEKIWNSYSEEMYKAEFVQLVREPTPEVNDSRSNTKAQHKYNFTLHNLKKFIINAISYQFCCGS